MNSFTHKLSSILGSISVLTGQIVSWLTVLMVLLLSLNVLASWLFNTSAILITESITWMHCANFLFAAAYTLNNDEHVRVDVLYSRFSNPSKAWVNLLGSLLLLLPVTTFILWSSWSYVVLSWRINEVSAEAGGMPATFLLKGMLLIMPVLLILEAINQILKSIQQISSKPTNNDAYPPQQSTPIQVTKSEGAH